VGRFGHKVVVRPVVSYRGREKCDAAVTIGAGGNVGRIHKDLRAAGILFLCISDGFVRRRKGWNSSRFEGGATNEGVSYWGVARNGLHAYGEHVGLKGRGPERWNALNVKLKPWRKDGKVILIGFQPHRRPMTVSVPAEDRSRWFPVAIKRISKLTRRPMVFKPHPHDHKNVLKVFADINRVAGNRMTFSRASLDDLLAQGVWAGVTFDSNLAVDLTIAGIPVFTGGHTMADPVVNTDLGAIENPVMGERTEWSHWFAWGQWNKDEMKKGLPWRYLVEEWDKYKG